jgi:adenylyltransferase/sulfurtransferase
VTIPDISVTELEQWFKEKKQFLLLDIREPEERHIVEFPQTTHRITMGDLQRDFPTLPDQMSLVVYCRSGIRSVYVTRFFLDEGYEMALNLKGGILEYIKIFKKDWPVY